MDGKGPASLTNFFHVVPVLRSGQHSCAMAHSVEPNTVLWPTAQNQTLPYGPEPRTKSCAIAHRAEISRRFFRSFRVRPIAVNQLRRSGP